MAGPYVTGPAHLYLGRSIPASSGLSSTLTLATSIYYLGTCEQPPRLSVHPQWEPFFNDLGGAMLPIDYCYQGKDGELVGTLNYWNDAVYRAYVESVASQSNTYPGTEEYGDTAVMWQHEGRAYQMWMQFPYYTKAYGTARGMAPGYHFWSMRPVLLEINPGTRIGKRPIAWKIDRVYSPSDGKVVLFDNLPASFASIPGFPPTTHSGLVT